MCTCERAVHGSPVVVALVCIRTCERAVHGSPVVVALVCIRTCERAVHGSPVVVALVCIRTCERAVHGSPVVVALVCIRTCEKERYVHVCLYVCVSVCVCCSQRRTGCRCGITTVCSCLPTSNRRSTAPTARTRTATWGTLTWSGGTDGEGACADLVCCWLQSHLI